MTIRMLINAMAANELRIAIVEDGELTELDIEASETSTLKGNVYKGVIHNVEGSLEAAFVDIGRHKQGFLPFSEVSPSQYYRPSPGSGRPRITDVLKRGQEIIVQVAKDAIGEKGATLTTYLSIPGRYTVLMPDSDAGGISRKIEDEKVRKRIRALSQRMKKPDNCGFIVRTAGYGQTRLALQKDLDKVVEQWRKLKKAAEIARSPSILHSEPDLIGRTLRDFFSDEIDEVLIDSEDEYATAVGYFKEVMPVYTDRLIHYTNPIPIFSYYHVEEQIEATFERQVKMPGGGSIVIDETEALVAVDVNSGKMTSEGDHERTVFKTNCEAAEAIARQLKLRDLGGIVVIDFIDMEESRHKREVEKILAEAAKEDKARYKISRINSKGLCVLTRQRIRQGMRKAFQHRCPICAGTGWLRSSESHSLALLRRVEARLAQGGVGEVRVLTHRETAEYLLNHKRVELTALERNYNCRIVVVARAEMDRGKDDVTYLSNKEVLEEITDRLPPREERRLRGGKRRRRKGKRGAEESAPPLVVEAVTDTERDDRNRRRKRKRRGRGDFDTSSKIQSLNGAVVLEPKGTTTFTGKLSPDELARAKQARLARKSGASSPIVELPSSGLFDEGSDVYLVDDVGVSGEEFEPVTVSQALAVAEAVQLSGLGYLDESAVLEALERGQEEPEEIRPPEDQAVAAEAEVETTEGTQTEPSTESTEELEETTTAEAFAEDKSDERLLRRRRRRRRGRRKKGDEVPTSETTDKVFAAEDESSPEVSQPKEKDMLEVTSQPETPIMEEAVDPATQAARKALLLRIFGAR